MRDDVKLIVNTLRECAVATQCSKCVVFCGNDECLFTAAAKAIESLAAENERLNAAIAAGAKMQRERDAAVEDVAKLKRCEHCIGYEEFLKPDGNIERCNECEERSLWQWRGVKED